MAINVPRGRTPHQNNIVTGAKQNGGNKGITLITHHLHSREVEEGNQQDGCKTCHRTLKSQIVGRNHLRHCSQHVGKGGFSKRKSPFMVGTSQLPSCTISRAVTMLRASMISGTTTRLLIKKEMIHINNITHPCLLSNLSFML